LTINSISYWVSENTDNSPVDTTISLLIYDTSAENFQPGKLIYNTLINLKKDNVGKLNCLQIDYNKVITKLTKKNTLWIGFLTHTQNARYDIARVPVDSESDLVYRYILSVKTPPLVFPSEAKTEEFQLVMGLGLKFVNDCGNFNCLDCTKSRDCTYCLTSRKCIKFDDRDTCGRYTRDINKCPCNSSTTCKTCPRKVVGCVWCESATRQTTCIDKQFEDECSAVVTNASFCEIKRRK